MTNDDEQTEREALADLFRDVHEDPDSFETPAVRIPPDPSSGGGLATLADLDSLAPVGKLVVRKRSNAQDAAETETDEPIARAEPKAGAAAVGPGWKDERSAWWKWGFPITMLLIILVVPVLAYNGYRTILESNDSNRVVTDKQENEPGYQVLVAPTPTMVVGFTDDDGRLTAVSVLSLTGETASGIVVMHPGTVGPVPGEETYTVAEIAYEEGGETGLADMVGAMLNVGLAEVAIVSPDQLETLIGPAAPLTIDSNAVVTTPETRFARGEITLAADEAAPYLSTRNEDTEDLDRMDRYVAFWESWLEAIAADGSEGIVPGETDVGLGYFLRQMASGQRELSVLPVEPKPVPGGGPTDHVYVPLHPQTAELMTMLVPFPVGSPPGARIRIRLLDGTGELEHGVPAASTLVLQGGEIAAIGNASTFDHTTTQIIYHNEVMAESAEQMRDALGVGEVLESEAKGESVDLIVILGADWSEGVAAQTGSTVTVSVVATSLVEVDDG